MKFKKIYFIFPLLFILMGCGVNRADDSGNSTPPSGFFTENGKKGFWFSGIKWFIKESSTIVGPGNNYFSSDRRDIFIDGSGRLHLKISDRDGIWWCTEFYSDMTVSHGSYNIVIDSGLVNLDPNAVLGFFTWDNDSYLTNANTEIDIEFSRWKDPKANNLHYSVQPVFGPDAANGFYKERNKQCMIDFSNETTIHSFSWSDSLISFISCHGTKLKEDNKISSFEYSKDNPGRKTNGEGTMTNPVGIPATTPSTKLHVNLWLVKGDHNYGTPPYFNKEIEIIISKIEYKK